MAGTKIYIVDAFASAPYKGNPAAVLIIEDFPKTMPLIAAEMNLSETAFVKPLSNDHYHIRWFTPKTEVKLCGHATLAAAHVLFEKKCIKGNVITFESLSGLLKVERQGASLALNFPLQLVTDSLDIDKFETLLNLSGKIVEVLKAFDDLLIVLKDEKDVRNFMPERLEEIEARGVIISARAKDFDFISRFFAPRVGVMEDPVTGSAHCKLANYWSQKLGKTELKAYQASKRGGELALKVIGERVLILGQATTVMEGEWKGPL